VLEWNLMSYLDECFGVTQVGRHCKGRQEREREREREKERERDT
jgi:hypothetical protein